MWCETKNDSDGCHRPKRPAEPTARTPLTHLGPRHESEEESRARGGQVERRRVFRSDRRRDGRRIAKEVVGARRCHDHEVDLGVRRCVLVGRWREGGGHPLPLPLPVGVGVAVAVSALAALASAVLWAGAHANVGNAGASSSVAPSLTHPLRPAAPPPALPPSTGLARASMWCHTSSGETPVPSSARVAAVEARSLRPMPSGSRWRDEMPVRSDIHSSVVSRPIPSRSVLGITCGAAQAPQPVGRDRSFDLPGVGASFSAALSSCEVRRREEGGV